MTRFQALALAAAVLAPVAMSAATPAVANPGVERSAVRPFASRHHAARAGWPAFGRARPLTRIAATPAHVASGGPWYGREFVLILGIGF